MTTIKYTHSQQTAERYVRRSVVSGSSVNQSLNRYRAGGGHIRRQWFIGLYRHQQRLLMTKLPYNPNHINFDKRHSLKYFQGTPKLEDKYQYKVRLGEDPATQKGVFATINSSERLTRQQILDNAERVYEERKKNTKAKDCTGSPVLFAYDPNIEELRRRDE